MYQKQQQKERKTICEGKKGKLTAEKEEQKKKSQNCRFPRLCYHILIKKKSKKIPSSPQRRRKKKVHRAEHAALKRDTWK